MPRVCAVLRDMVMGVSTGRLLSPTASDPAPAASVVASMLNKDTDAAEKYLVGVIRDGHLEGRIDSAEGHLVMNPMESKVYVPVCSAFRDTHTCGHCCKPQRVEMLSDGSDGVVTAVHAAGNGRSRSAPRTCCRARCRCGTARYRSPRPHPAAQVACSDGRRERATVRAVAPHCSAVN